jgi:hypothetical protein
MIFVASQNAAIVARFLFEIRDGKDNGEVFLHEDHVKKFEEINKQAIENGLSGYDAGAFVFPIWKEYVLKYVGNNGEKK